MYGRRGIWLLAALTAGAAASITAPLSGRPGLGLITVPVLVLVLAFAFTDLVVVHFEHRSEAHSVSFSAIPLVVALFALAPLVLIGARIAGSIVAMVLRRRRWAPIKAAVNLSSFWLGDVLAVHVFFALVPSEAFGVGTWPAAFAAAIVSDQVQGLVVTSAIGLYQRRFELLTGPVLLGTVGTAASACLAIVAVTLLEAEPAALLLLAATVPALYASYRVYARLRAQHRNLEQLYEFTRNVSEAVIHGRVVPTILDEIQELMHADDAWLCVEEASGILRVPGGGGVARVPAPMPSGSIDDLLHRRAHDAGRALLLSVQDPSVGPGLRALGVEQVLVSPVNHVGSSRGTLVVADRSGDVRDFDEDDLRLFATLVTHAATTLENDHLVEQLRQQAAASEYQSLHDALTGLPNRSLLGQRLASALQTGRSLAVLLLDLDRFKEVNDTLGHHHGDVLLQAVSQRLQGAVRSSDMVARFGGDEFAVLLVDVHSVEAAEHIATQIVTTLRAPLAVAGISVTVDASVGIALAPDHGTEPSSLLSRADVAMYSAKGNRTRVEVYRPESDDNTTDRLLLAARLRTALEEGQLAVHFQPQVDLSSSDLIGAEALVRWAGDASIDVSPQELVALAEHTGMIRGLTSYVLDAAVRECAGWWARGRRLRVSVNLSAHDLLDVGLVTEVLSRLDEAGLPSEALCLELTETSVMADPGRTIPILRELHEAGIAVAVDDFGTGYSSLAYLRQLPVDEIKIDKSFVLGMDTDPDDEVIVRSVVDLGRNLGLRVVAEGVETDALRRQLQMLGCAGGQGYVFSRPLPSEDLAGWMTGRDPRPVPEQEVMGSGVCVG